MATGSATDPRLALFLADYVTHQTAPPWRGAVVLNEKDANADLCRDLAHRSVPCVTYQEKSDLDRPSEWILSHDFGLVAFVGDGHGDLIDMLQAYAPEFFNRKQTLVPRRHGTIRTLRLKLNSKVSLYSETEAGYAIEETYKIKDGPVVTNMLGNWSVEDGMDLSPTPIWRRRSDLGGVRLANMMKNNTYFTRAIPRSRGIINQGLFQDIFRQMSADLNFTYWSRLPPDGKWGSRPDGQRHLQRDGGNAAV